MSIRLCSEVTNWESPQIQAKSEILQPVAEMPASTAEDCWKLGSCYLGERDVFREVGRTYSASGYPIKACSAGKGSGQEGESGEGVFHFFFFFSLVFLFSCFRLALRASGKLFWLEY